MTEEVRRRRASKRELRAWAWVAGAIAFVAPAAVLGAVPKPPQDTTAQATKRPDIVIRKITRRIVITRPTASAPVRYVSAGTTSGSSAVSSTPAATSTGGS
jgi:hypothetical protein